MATLVLTGAGNVELTRRILSDLFVVPELTGTLRVVLHDIDRERLETAQVLAERLNAEAGAAAVIEAHLDRRAALDGADFVICEIAVGGYQATQAGLRDPGPVRAAPDHRRHARHRRHLPRAAHHPGAGRPSATTWPSCCPARAAAELHEPDVDERQGGLRGDPVRNVVGCLPLGPGHPAAAGRRGRAASDEVAFRTAGAEPPGVRAANSSGAARTCIQGLDEAIEKRPRAAAHGPGRDVAAFRLLPDRVQRTRLGISPLVPAQRRPDQAVPHPGRRVPRAGRADPAHL